MDRMPLELIVKFLEYLTRHELRCAANVSRTLYTAAQEAGCSMLLRIHLTRDDAYEDALAILDAVVEHALAKPPEYRPGISLRLFVHASAAHADFDAPFHRILGTIEKALPLLVSLDSYVPAMFTDALHRTLCASGAPRLRNLFLVQVNDAESPAIAIPANLFAETAPRLRTVCLGLPSLDARWELVGVFRRVSAAHLILYRPAQRTIISGLLPRVNSLIVSLVWHKHHRAERSPEIDLSGLNLRFLALEGDAQMLCDISGIDVRLIPVVESAIEGRFLESFWDTATPPDMTVGICFGDGRRPLGTRVRSTCLVSSGWKRTVFTDRSPVVQLMAARLSVVVIHSGPSLGMFLTTPAVLPALSEFCVDFSSGAGLGDLDFGANHSLPARLLCPALRSVTLLARKNLFEIRAERVAALGQLLRQEERSAAERAVLKLVRVSFIRPTARKLVDRIFPSIEVVSQPDPELVRLAESCTSPVKDSLVPYVLVRHPSPGAPS